MDSLTYIIGQTGFSEKSIRNTLNLLNDGATIPFISRYRKEQIDGLDEVGVAKIRDLNESFNTLQNRKQTVLKAIEEQGKLTNELKEKIEGCLELLTLEDLYLPYKSTRKTRADKAKDLGLEGLAKMIMSQQNTAPETLAQRFLTKEVKTAEEAIRGAQDIIAGWVNEHIALRAILRENYYERGMLEAKVIPSKKEEAEKYSDYFDYSASLKRCPSHRFLALHRAVNEGLFKLKITVDKEWVERRLERFFIKGENASSECVRSACWDAYKRLLHPTIENEVLHAKKEEADLEAIKVFEKNLRQLLLAPPVGQKRVLAIDPGFRTGCKVVCLDESGDLLTNATIFPHPPQKEFSQAQNKLRQLVEAYKIEAIAIGDGTAGRETETLVKKTGFSTDVNVFVVSEDGASIYSASAIGRKEFPTYDVTVRGAVSIGRRLMDPLAELVKIDPKSVGVGQYQHEVNQVALKKGLDDVVVSCVNQVGVDVNTASTYLLSYISGLGPQLAENIVAYRSENGPFTSRKELLKVPRLGNKAFEQCAGFLRISNASYPLDNSAVHPESYHVVEKMAQKKGVTLDELVGNEQLLNEFKSTDFPELDTYTFEDIIKELKKPGRDPRKTAKILAFDETVRSISDLKVGKVLNGIVTNVTNFGAFVNIGIKENGLIHKSNLSDSYVENPIDVIALHEHVKVEVLEVDEGRKRIGLKKV